MQGQVLTVSDSSRWLRCRYCQTQFRAKAPSRLNDIYCSPTCQYAGLYGTADERFRRSYTIQGECWIWSRPINKNGYAHFQDKRKWLAHRWSYQRFVGPIPPGLTLDHLCRNRACVNPAHLEAVTIKVNVQRGHNFQRDKTHCAQGHEYTPDNIIFRSNGYRQCRECNRRNCKRSYAKRAQS